jgi:hypothetical protein
MSEDPKIKLIRERDFLKARMAEAYLVPMRDRLQLEAVEEQIAAIEREKPR